jgi:hypothetical protein
MRTVNGLFDEMAAACQFPYYFGENWAAFAECLGDLDWMNSTRFVLAITEFDEILADEAKEQGAFGRALGNAIDAFNREKGNPETQDSLFQILINRKLRFEGPIIDEIGSPTILST